MRICPECQCNKLSENTKFCPECGFKLKVQMNTDQVDDDLIFEETDNSSYVGETEKIEIEQPGASDCKDDAIDPHLEKALESNDDELELIGGIGSESNAEETNPSTDYHNTDDNKDEIRKLTPEEKKAIEKKLYRNDTSLNKKPQRQDPLFGNDPILPVKNEEPTIKKIHTNNEPTLDMPVPTMAEHDRGYAFFYKNYIELVGTHDLRSNDEIIIGKKTYELKPKQINPKILMGSAAGLFIVLLIFVGSMIAGDSPQGQGNVWGIALDEFDQPLITNTKARFPELGKTINCNAEGFFVFKDIPSGTHKIQLLWDNNVIGENFTTVTDDKLTTLTLQPGEEFLSKYDDQSNTNEELALVNNSDEMNNNADKVDNATTQQKTKKVKKSTSSQLAKLALESNIENAVISLDGSAIGAGNLTYNRLKSGDYVYEVKKDGYYTKTGNITLIAGKTNRLEVALEPLSEVDLRKTFTSIDFYNSGIKASSADDFMYAIDEFSLALKDDPNYIDAYEARAETFIRLNDMQRAHDDYLRVAEIHQFNRDYNQSISAYNKAVELNDKSISAYLGRAKLYMVKNQEMAAIPDFEEVLRIDKKNSQANYGLGIARYNQKSYKKATKLFKEALSLDESNPIIHQYLMLCYYARDDKKNLKKAYTKFEEKASNDQIDEFRSNAENYAVVQIIDKDR